MPEITVRTRSGSYPILVGNGVDRKLASAVRKSAGSARVFLIADANVHALYGDRFHKMLHGVARKDEVFVVPAGEKSKIQRTVSAIQDHLLALHISRSDFILAAGGGVTTDIAGYVAATTLRGVRWGALPTTLLGMVDAAIGGKTGINHSQGKNLIGAIWQPSFVLCDSQYLQTLPIRHIVAGYGEILKYGGLVGGPMLRQVGALVDGGVGQPDWMRVIQDSVRYKASIVSKDEREDGIRAYLNLGHTFGHAIEKTIGYGKLLHGEAVIVGLLGAVCLSMLYAPKSARELKDYYRLVLNSTELVPRMKLNSTALIGAMSLDKKRLNQSMRYVLLKRPGQPYLATGLPVDMVRFAVEQMIADYNDFGGKYAPRIGR